MTYTTRMDACREAITIAMQEARTTGETQTIDVCLDCPRDWRGHSCIACDRITVDPSGKVEFESHH